MVALTKGSVICVHVSVKPVSSAFVFGTTNSSGEKVFKLVLLNDRANFVDHDGEMFRPVDH